MTKPFGVVKIEQGAGSGRNKLQNNKCQPFQQTLAITFTFRHMTKMKCLHTGEMRFPTVRLVGFLLIGLIDTGNTIYYRYILEVDTNIGYAAHFAGAVAGFLLGIVNNYNICSQAFKAKT